VRIYRDGLVEALLADPRLGPVDAVVDAGSCRDAVERRRPSVAIIDASSRGALAVARELRETGVGVVALGIAEQRADVVAFAEAGVSAYLTFDQTLEDLVDAVLAVGRGEAGCSPRVTALLLRHVAALAGDHGGPSQRGRMVPLTPREREVLALLGDGLTNQQIALRLSIQLATVKHHVHNILAKLGARSRAQAVAVARR
jgi:two-component system, NarL family, nitrate/nitrite response regulator NarL